MVGDVPTVLAKKPDYFTATYSIQEIRTHDDVNACPLGT